MNLYQYRLTVAVLLKKKKKFFILISFFLSRFLFLFASSSPSFSMLFVSLFLTATICLARATASLALFKIALAHPARSPHRLFKIVSPKPPQALSRGYEWAGFLKSDLGCRYLIGFMVVGMNWLKALAYGCGLIDLVVGCCGLCRGLKLCGGWFFFFFFNAIECHG